MLTTEEQKIIEYAKKNGKTAQEGVAALSRYRATIQPAPEKPKSFMQDLGGDIKGIGTGIKSDIQERGKKLGTILEAGATGKQGKLSTAFQATTNFLGAIGDAIGQVFKGGTKAVLTQGAEEGVKSSVASFAKKVMSLPETKQFIENYKTLEKEDPVKARNVVALSEGGQFLLNFAGLKLGKDAVSGGLKAGQEAVTAGVDTVKSAAKAGREAIEPLVKQANQAAQPLLQEAARLPERFAINAAEKQATEAAIKQLPRETTKVAVRDGIDIADVKTLVSSASTVANKSLVRKIASSVKAFASGAAKTNPIEVVGQPIVSGIKQLESLRGTVGKKLGDLAAGLGRVSQKELRPTVLAELKKVPGLSGLKTTMTGVLDFSDTVLATGLSKSDRMAIRKIFDEAVKDGAGRSKHLLRQELFEILGGQKSSLKAITATQEKAFEAVRKALATVLESKSAGYKSANQQFAKLMKPLTDLRKLMRAVGATTDDDILNMSAGLLARRLTSNAASNPQIRAILRDMDAVLKSTGKGVEGSVEVAQDVYNVLNKYYNIAGGTTFQSGVSRGVEQSRGLVDMAVGMARNAAGESEAVRQKAIENLLNDLLR